MKLIPISDKDFRKVAKGCGIKYRNKIPGKELKEMLGYCPLNFTQKVEISDDFGFSRVFKSMNNATKYCGISHNSVIKYALDHGKPSIKRRSDKKIFYVKEII